MHRARRRTGRRRRPKGWGEPFSPSRCRSARLPLTLLADATTGAQAAVGLQALAAAMTFRRPCYAAMLQRCARQMQEGLTAAQAVVNWTETPQPNAALSETVFSEPSLGESVLNERPLEPLDF